MLDKSNVIKCEDGNDYSTDFEQGKSCDFDFRELFEQTGCTELNHYGYKSNRPCVLIKVNKIYGWTPEFDKEKKKKIEVICKGEVFAEKNYFFNLINNFYFT